MGKQTFLRLLLFINFGLLASCNLPQYEEVWLPRTANSVAPSANEVCNAQAVLQATEASNSARVSLANEVEKIPLTELGGATRRQLRRQEIDLLVRNLYNSTYSAVFNNCMVQQGYTLQQVCVANCD